MSKNSDVTLLVDTTNRVVRVIIRRHTFRDLDGSQVTRVGVIIPGRNIMTTGDTLAGALVAALQYARIS